MADITSKPVPRQTIPYADRPFVDPRTGRLTQESYQFLQRIAGAGSATVENVGTVITQTNANSSTIVEVQTTVEAQGSQIAQVQTQVAQIDASSGAPPPMPAPPPLIAGPPAAVARPALPVPPPAPPPGATPPAQAPGRPAIVVLPPSMGGTGQSASPQDGQLLIGDTAAGGWDVGMITPGANVSITTGAGAVTISASGTTGVSTIVAGPGLSGATITSAGTIALETIAAAALLGNTDTVSAVPTPVAIGTGLTAAAGTLDALWNSGTVTTLGPNLSSHQRHARCYRHLFRAMDGRHCHYAGHQSCSQRRNPVG